MGALRVKGPARPPGVPDQIAALEQRTLSLESSRATVGKGHVRHGSDPDAARPADYASIEWVGSVAPNNVADGDTVFIHTP